MNAQMPTRLVTDEVDFFQDVIPVRGARVVELGCGKAAFSRSLLQRGLASSVDAFEVDAAQHAANLAAPPVAGLRFGLAGAQAIPLPDDSCDVAVMLKSLHHVPMDLLDGALAEIARVLVPGGWLYVSEPVYAGEFNDIVKLFHDEGEVRAAAYAALRRAADKGVLRWEREMVFDTPLHFRDFDDFVDRIVRVTHSEIELDPAVATEVRRRFERFPGPGGAHFVRQMRINLLRA
ncbi:MAG: class I SAM-dependent methyltransferase [Burkholderiales bacterium]|nr:class I SAM-dependent methyltransferase [Burkholderiales bacterium]